MLSLSNGLGVTDRYYRPVGPNLLPNLIAHWKLEEATGTRYDAHSNGLHLTDNNTVQQFGGKVGSYSALFDPASSEYLSRAYSPILHPQGNSFSFTCWVQLDNKTAFRPIIAMWNGTNLVWGLAYNNSSARFEFKVRLSGSTIIVGDTTLGTVYTGVWYFIACWYISGASLNIQINQNAVNTISNSGTMASSTPPLHIGRQDSLYTSGKIDSMSYWIGRAIGQTETYYLYNNGNGLDYDQF